MKFLALSLFIIGAVLLIGQSNPESAPLVNLNVTAVDGQGRPVPDLRAEDFQILDNSKPRKIVWFRALQRKRSQAVPATFILLESFQRELRGSGTQFQ